MKAAQGPYLVALRVTDRSTWATAVRRAYRSMASRAHGAELLGISIPTFRKWCRELGFADGSPGRKKKKAA